VALEFLSRWHSALILVSPSLLAAQFVGRMTLLPLAK
jgi:hypothetical protein